LKEADFTPQTLSDFSSSIAPGLPSFSGTKKAPDCSGAFFYLVTASVCHAHDQYLSDLRLPDAVDQIDDLDRLYLECGKRPAHARPVVDRQDGPDLEVRLKEWFAQVAIGLWRCIGM
jgi:hypothetical protein